MAFFLIQHEGNFLRDLQRLRGMPHGFNGGFSSSVYSDFVTPTRATRITTTEVFGSNGFRNKEFSGITDILTIPKLKFCIKKAQSNIFLGVIDKMAIPT